MKSHLVWDVGRGAWHQLIYDVSIEFETLKTIRLIYHFHYLGPWGPCNKPGDGIHVIGESEFGIDHSSRLALLGFDYVAAHMRRIALFEQASRLSGSVTRSQRCKMWMDDYKLELEHLLLL